MRKAVTYFFTVIIGIVIFNSRASGHNYATDKDSILNDSVSTPNHSVQRKLFRLEKLVSTDKNDKKGVVINLAGIQLGQSGNKGTVIRFSGYIRAFVQDRVMQQAYAGTMPKLLTLNGVDVKDQTIIKMGANNMGYPEPFLYLRAAANPSPNTSFLIDYYFDNQMIGSDTSGRISTLYRMLQFQATTRTDIGSFKLIAGGGVNYYRLSPFTLWGIEYRDDMFERYPWEPEAENGTSFSRYERYYNTQNIPRDARWGNTGTQGFILEASNLPAGFGATVLYGKVDNSGAFAGFQTQAPRNMISGRVDKIFGSLGRHKFGVNIFDQFGYITSIGTGALTQKIYTGDLRINFRGVNLFTEMGAGQYVDPLYNFGWGKALNIQADFDKSLTKIPAILQFYYIDKSVINVNSGVINSSHPNLQAAYGVGDSYTITTYEGVAPEFGLLTNNRTGAYLKIFDSFLKSKKLKVILNTGASQEIEHMNNQVTLYHRANAFTRSRFTYFQNYVGPYNRLMSIYRRTFEHFTITSTAPYSKAFNVLDLTLKYRLRIIGRDLLLSNYVTYNSVQNGFSPVPKFNDGAYFRQVYEEIMAFYRLLPRLTLVGFFGLERIKGNKETDLAPNGKPADQTGTGYGIGFDYDYAARAGFYFRHRWFSQKDPNFTLDRFNGQETSMEMKIFF